MHVMNTHSSALREAIARIEAANPSLHAFTAIADPAVLERSAARARGPLAGKLVAVKDIFDTGDLPTCYGSPIYAGHRSAGDAALVGAIRRAGGLVAGKSVTTEFAYLNPPATTNPAAPGCTPGGSSSGSAAAVAAGLVPLAIGSQTGGSVVRPASYCGVVGFKPSFGVLPTAGMKCFSWSLDTAGLFARTVAEVAQFAQAVSGGMLAIGAARPAQQWTVGIGDSYPWGSVSASAAQALAQARAALERAGVRVVSIALPDWAEQAFRAHDGLQGWEAVRSLAHEMDRHADQLSPILREYLESSLAITDEAFMAARALCAQARAGSRRWFEGVDVLLTPSAPDEPPEGYGSTGVSTYNRAWTLLGAPTINVPGLQGANGRPMGVQVIAPYGRDGICLAAAAMLEAAMASR